MVKHWDAIIVGAGIIGLSLAIELKKRGFSVLIVDKGEPGREASWAAGGMLADFPLEMPPALRDLAAGSARMYPEFVHELEDESHIKIDLRDHGTLLFGDPEKLGALDSAFHSSPGDSPLSPRPLNELEPALFSEKLAGMSSLFLKERSVDPRHVSTAAIAAAKHRGIDFSSGDQVLAVELADGKAAGVRTNKTSFASGVVVNCAGAWAGQIHPGSVPTRPVKGQMLCVVMPQRETVRHVIRTPDVYLIPRSDGRILIGATQEEAGFDKQTVPETIQKLRRAALEIAPKLADARILEAWAGLRPGTPDALPILGATSTSGYFIATGHFRDGILLAPVTARIMGQLIAGESPQLELTAFRVERFAS
jgi:glycine oxidase